MLNTPSIHLQNFQGEAFDLLEKYEGQNLLILLYNNQCLGCTGRAIPFAYKMQQEFADLQVIGIHSNFSKTATSEEAIKSIFTSKELPFPIYLDEKHRVYDQFQSEGTPQWIIIAKDKTIFRSIFGSQAGAQNRIVYALRELLQV